MIDTNMRCLIYENVLQLGMVIPTSQMREMRLRDLHAPETGTLYTATTLHGDRERPEVVGLVRGRARM